MGLPCSSLRDGRRMSALSLEVLSVARSSTASCWHVSQDAEIDRTPFSRMLASVIGSMIRSRPIFSLP